MATTATRIAGSTATRLKRPTICTWQAGRGRPGPTFAHEFLGLPCDDPDEQDDQGTVENEDPDDHVMGIGRIGVTPDSTRNVVSADASAVRTAIGPSQPKLRCGISATWRCA